MKRKYDNLLSYEYYLKWHSILHAQHKGKRLNKNIKIILLNLVQAIIDLPIIYTNCFSFLPFIYSSLYLGDMNLFVGIIYCSNPSPFVEKY